MGLVARGQWELKGGGGKVETMVLGVCFWCEFVFCLFCSACVLGLVGTGTGFAREVQLYI